MFQRLKDNKVISYLGLFSSFGTLICCAIPSTLVLLGFGASLAGFIGKYPQFIWLSDNKEVVFGFSFFMLAISYAGQKISQRKSCPIEKKDDCEQTKGWSKPLFYLTAGINLVGAFYAFILPRLL